VSDAGTPTISDPGNRLIKAAVEAGIRVESIPGPNAVVAALAASGLPTDAFSFLGFPPTRSKAKSEWFERVRAIGGTIVFFEAPHRIRETLERLRSEVGDCQIVVCRELTKKHEELVRGPISAVLTKMASPLGEFTVVADVGHLTDNGSTPIPNGQDILIAFGELTKLEKMSRRRAVATLARRHGVGANLIYGIIETAKKSG
jgi:16S rRNA (cytidine1402-2'-O)-methyltransferase